MGDILNNLTHEQLVAIRDRALAKKELRPCLWCAKETLMKKDQRFCCDSHRNLFNRHAAEYLKDAHAAEKRAWEIERAELLREIADLRRHLSD